MTTKTLQTVRKYPFSVFCILLIWILSFAPFFPETPLDDVAFIDKWTHLIMYGGTCLVIWTEYLRKHTLLNKKKLFCWAWLAPIVMSGIIEPAAGTLHQPHPQRGMVRLCRQLDGSHPCRPAGDVTRLLQSFQ